MIARLTANTPTSPVEAGSIATAATPVGMLPARNSSRCGAVEHGEADPRPPQREEEPERDPHGPHLGLGDDQVRELPDREDDDQVELELDPRNPLVAWERLGQRAVVVARADLVRGDGVLGTLVRERERELEARRDRHARRRGAA